MHVVNASTRVRSCYTAYTYPTISCAGVATDDNLPFDVRATLFRKR